MSTLSSECIPLKYKRFLLLHVGKNVTIHEDRKMIFGSTTIIASHTQDIIK